MTQSLEVSAHHLARFKVTKKSWQVFEAGGIFECYLRLHVVGLYNYIKLAVQNAANLNLNRIKCSRFPYEFPVLHPLALSGNTTSKNVNNQCGYFLCFEEIFAKPI